MILKLILSLKVLTPLFLGDAEQMAELRVPGIKGPLRYWYRAADPRFNKPWQQGAMPTREDRLFGGIRPGAGQSPVLMRIEPSEPEVQTWSQLRPERFNRGQGRDTRNGLVYLGYPFGLRGNADRTAIVPGHRFRVRCLLPRPKGADTEHEQALRRGLMAAWWLLCHSGGLGSRCRRGFGSIALESWDGSVKDWPELGELPVPGLSTDPAGWRSAFHQGLTQIQQWLGTGAAAPEARTGHPHLGQALRWTLLEPGHPVDRWDAALADAGSRMQEFRLRRTPDYQLVKDHVLARNRQGGRPMRAAPNRASFGLPLTFRFTSVSAPALTLVPHDAKGGGHFERHGSLLHLRLVNIGDRLHPLYLRLDGAVPGEDPPAMVRNELRPLEPCPANAMDQFMDSLAGGQARG